MSVLISPRVAARPRAGTRGVCKSRVIAHHSSSSGLSEHYEELRELGSGSYGRVILVRDKTFGQERVCKVVSTDGMSPFVLEAMRKEIELLRKLDHPSIVRLYEYAEDPKRKQLLLILEYISGGDCAELIQKSTEPLGERLVGRLVYQLLVALAYCHLRGVAHRDVKPLNMMVLYPKGGGEPDCKLIDFGLSEGGAAEMRDYVGSPKYMAPEIHRRASYTSRADIWSAGISALELLMGELQFTAPYEQSVGACTGFEELEKCFKGKPAAAWKGRSREAQDFIRTMLQVDPATRLSAGEALSHPWLETNRPPGRQFPKDIARSLADFADAPSIVRCCLHSIAARVGSPNIQALGHAFLGADSDGDGLISDADLEAALGHVELDRRWWCSTVEKVDVEEVLRTGDLDHNAGLGFTEFVAACLFATHGNAEGFAQLAFDALDSDRDGLVSVEELQQHFRERDRPFLDSLPQDEPFGFEEWRMCLEEYDLSTQVLSSSEESLTPRRRFFGLFDVFSCLG